MFIREAAFMALYMKIFFVLFLLGLVGCMKVSVNDISIKCDIDTIDGAMKQCTENPTVTLNKDF